MNAVDGLTILLIAAGCCFYIAGGVGMLRFPDAASRLHAATKADNVGLGLVIFGVMLQADSWFVAAKLVLIWVFLLAASTTACHLIARTALGVTPQPWSKP